MDDCWMIDLEEGWEIIFKKDEPEEDSLLLKYLRVFDYQIKLRKKKKSNEQKDEIESYYNVSIYRVLPYPPNSKDVKDSFIHKN